MAVKDSKVKHLVGNSPIPSSGLVAGTLYYAKQSDGQYVIYIAEDATTAKKVTTIIDSKPTNGSGDIVANDTLVSAFGKVQGRIKNLEEKSASMFSIKGTIGTGGTVTSLPSNPTTGDAYRVVTEGTYGDHEVEVNDWLVCSVGGSFPTWVVLQGNIELEDIEIATASDANGYIITISVSGISRSVNIPFASSSVGGFMSKTQATKLASLTNYSLPTANNTTLGGVKLSDATNSTSGVNGGVAATPNAVRVAYNLAAGKWTYNADTIKSVKVNNAANADKATSDKNGNNISSTYLRKTDNNGTDIPQTVDNSTSFERDVTFGSSIIVGDEVLPYGDEGADIGKSDCKFGTVYAANFEGTASYATSANNARGVVSTNGNLRFTYDDIDAMDNALTWGTW